jgi:hypothetical protein
MINHHKNQSRQKEDKMHETDAMQFIEPVLLGFLSRHFGYEEGENPSLYEPHLKKIQLFIQDAEPYWVKEKSLQIIENIEAAECQIRSGLYTPDSAGDFLTTVLNKAKKRIEETSKYHQLENNKRKTSIFVPMPFFP